MLKSVHVPLIDNTRWDTHTEFTARLSRPMGAVLGEYLSAAGAVFLSRFRPFSAAFSRFFLRFEAFPAQETHVKIIDDDVFPSNRFRDQVEGDDMEPIRNELLAEYIKRNLSDPLRLVSQAFKA